MPHEPLADRVFGEVYRVQRRSDLHEFLQSAAESSGGRVLYTSDAGIAPIYLGVQLNSDERVGMLIYAFRMTRNATRNRPGNEVRGQLRYGSETTWSASIRSGVTSPVWMSR